MLEALVNFLRLEIKVERKHEKHHSVIFTCLIIMAIPLDVTHKLTSSEFINVLRKFNCRRRFPNVYCENGKNFKGADTELKDAFATLNQNKILKFCTLN